MDKKPSPLLMTGRQFGMFTGAAAAGLSLNMVPGFARLALAA